MYKIPSRNPVSRSPSNHPSIRGFHEPSDMLLGFPTAGRHEFVRDSDLVDPRLNASFVRHDLSLKYVYETCEEWEIDGEWVPFPVVRYVYRRDVELRWSEIKAYLVRGNVPFRYPSRKRFPELPWMNDPMNKENFEKYCRRFTVRDLGGGFCVLRERSTGLPIQRHYMRFEEQFAEGPGSTYNREFFTHVQPWRILKIMTEMESKYWYLDQVQRAQAAIDRARDGKPFDADNVFPNLAGFRGRNPKYPPLWKCPSARTSPIRIKTLGVCSLTGVKDHSLLIPLVSTRLTSIASLSCLPLGLRHPFSSPYIYPCDTLFTHATRRPRDRICKVRHARIASIPEKEGSAASLPFLSLSRIPRILPETDSLSFIIVLYNTAHMYAAAATLYPEGSFDSVCAGDRQAGGMGHLPHASVGAARSPYLVFAHIPVGLMSRVSDVFDSLRWALVTREHA
ncbi:hypothetical protein B0H12DRAFT_1236338 [Mycena haematopus]|nr:hypothetical protein B0H12DRAFT_1236338 [Mycena haematopus]